MGQPTLDQTLTLSQAYEKEEELVKEIEEIKLSIKQIYNNADLQTRSMFKKQDNMQDQLKIIKMEIKIREKPIHDLAVHKR